jgi:hypothetical protein
MEKIMDMQFLDHNTEKTVCPHCKGGLEISVGLRTTATIDIEPVTYRHNEYIEQSSGHAKDDFYPYQKCLPNIGACGQFFRATSYVREWLSNGHMAFIKSAMKNLEIDLDENEKPVNLEKAVDKFSDDLPKVVPVTQTRVYVRMMGEDVEMTAPCRCIHLAYALFPDAVFYQYGSPETESQMLCVVSGDELVGLIMGMKMQEDIWENNDEDDGEA